MSESDNVINFAQTTSTFFNGELVMKILGPWTYGDYARYVYGTAGTLYVVENGQAVELSKWANGQVKTSDGKTIELHNETVLGDPKGMIGLKGWLIRYDPTKYPPTRPLRPLEQAIPWANTAPAEAYEYGTGLDANGNLITGVAISERGGGMFPLTYYDRISRPYELAVREADSYVKYLLARVHYPRNSIVVDYFPEYGQGALFTLPLGDIVDSTHHPLEWAYLVNTGLDANYWQVRMFAGVGMTGIWIGPRDINGLFPTGIAVVQQPWFKQWQMENTVPPEALDWLNKNGQAEAFPINDKHYRLWMRPGPIILPDGIFSSGVQFSLMETDEGGRPNGGPEIAITQDLLLSLAEDSPTIDQIQQADTQDQSITQHKAEWADYSSGITQAYVASDGRRFVCQRLGPILVSPNRPIEWDIATPDDIAYANSDYLSKQANLGA